METHVDVRYRSDLFAIHIPPHPPHTHTLFERVCVLCTKSTFHYVTKGGKLLELAGAAGEGAKRFRGLV